ncbi:helix-turn-helix domain-containing protein [Methylophilus aquaticus]|uniref:DUF4115 domain-containing protein n=1 Tax=Methylophilus aquaticus TaxID=1971610 RepID=A0ABT9JVA6_9PROT|nr:helix-turn-helix domain-containing protein [Methylophilus aquaticus]MDP8568446.1 DUF4115 domain-containing protein [Methylophilus aquaticus]
MAEDQAKVGTEAPTGADKPKRTRKRKADTEKMSEQAFQVAADMQHSDIHLPSMIADATDMPNTETAHTQAPEEYAAAMAMENAPTQAPAVIITGSACGGQLKAAREALGLSIHEVSGQLRLGISQIQAIEQDDFAKLPQQSIVRGFIRNYARLLKVEAEPILAAYQRLVPTEAPLPLSVKSNANTSVIGKTHRPVRPQRYINLLIFLLLLSILTYFYINHIKPQTQKEATLPLDAGNISQSAEHIELPAPAVTTPIEESANNNIQPAPVVEGGPAETTPAISGEGQPVHETASTPATLSGQPLENTVVSTPTPAASNTPLTTLKAVNPTKTQLAFKVTEDSWIRVEDGQGNKVFSEVLTAGTERSITVEKPLSITVGHASGTQLSIDNQPYDLSQATRGRVARIQLK